MENWIASTYETSSASTRNAWELIPGLPCSRGTTAPERRRCWMPWRWRGSLACQATDSAWRAAAGTSLPNEIPALAKEAGDRSQFFECKPVSVEAGAKSPAAALAGVGKSGRTGREPPMPKRRTPSTSKNVTSPGFTPVRLLRARSSHTTVRGVPGFPRGTAANKAAGSMDLSADGRRSHDCFNERIRLNDLHAWFQREAIAFAGRFGSWRPGYHAVKHAILRCVPDSDNLWYDADRGELVPFDWWRTTGRLPTSVRASE